MTQAKSNGRPNSDGTCGGRTTQARIASLARNRVCSPVPTSPVRHAAQHQQHGVGATGRTSSACCRPTLTQRLHGPCAPAPSKPYASTSQAASMMHPCCPCCSPLERPASTTSREASGGARLLMLLLLWPFFRSRFLVVVKLPCLGPDVVVVVAKPSLGFATVSLGARYAQVVSCFPAPCRARTLLADRPCGHSLRVRAPAGRSKRALQLVWRLDGVGEMQGVKRRDQQGGSHTRRIRVTTAVGERG
jgi:hypothetical protein